MRTLLRSMLMPMGITAAVVAAPFAPPPLGFWLALAAALLGPGASVPDILFSTRVLTLPERVFISIITSILIDVGLLAGLNAVDIRLTQIVVSGIILSTTYVSTIAALIIKQRRQDAVMMQGHESPWLTFVCGTVLGILIVNGFLQMIGK